jgi:zinc finger HIT domain-containing protein 3
VALTAHPKLKEMLRGIDGLEGSAREEALQAALGVSRLDVGRGLAGQVDSGIGRIDEEERRAMRGLAEAIEAAVRGNNGNINRLFGLDWESPN